MKDFDNENNIIKLHLNKKEPNWKELKTFIREEYNDIKNSFGPLMMSVGRLYFLDLSSDESMSLMETMLIK